MKMKINMKMQMMMNINMKTKMIMKQWIKTKKSKIKGLNDNLDEIIDKSKSFEDQIKLFKKFKRSKRVLAL